ncbi:MAG: LamG domain-containing protein, partial [Planctomycetota bacterium]
VTFRKVTWRNQQPDHASLTYGLSNPLINLTGTSAHFHPWSEDVPGDDDIEHRVGLLRDAEGVDILDLAGEAYTIEMWIRQDSFYSWKYPGGDMDFPSLGTDPNYHATLIRKYNRSYVLAIGEDHAVRYGHSGSTITSGPNDSNNPVEIELGRWYHIGAVFDSTDPCEPQKLYINGEQVSGGGTSSLNPLDDDDYVGIGFRKQPTRVGPGLEQNYFDGLIDELRVTDVALNPNQFLMRGGPGQAWFPNPQSYSTDLQCNLDSLSWRPGDYVDDVNGHVLYIGTDWDEVNDANSTVHPNVEHVDLDVNSYDIPYLLNLDQVYYWRVDQVNDACDPYLWKGTIWRFSVAEYILIDDMEEYVEGYVDEDYTIAGSSGSYGWETLLNGHSDGSYLGLVTPMNKWIDTHGGEQSMVYLFFNSGAYYSEIANHFVIDPCDWTWGGVRMLSLWFYGDPLNTTEVTQQMYVGVEDNTGAGSYTEIRYPLEDMDDLQVEEWQQWPIPLRVTLAT